MTLTIQVPAHLEVALKAQASAQGISPTAYVRHLLERDLASAIPARPVSGNSPRTPAEAINANRTDMFRHCDEDEGEDF